jgi:hypothetical protein
MVSQADDLDLILYLLRFLYRNQEDAIWAPLSTRYTSSNMVHGAAFDYR